MQSSEYHARSDRRGIWRTLISACRLHPVRLGRQIVTLAFSVVISAFSATSVLADEYDALNFGAGTSAFYDSNVFRRAKAANPQSDTVYTGYLGLHFDKPYAQQRFQADITETATRYNNFSYLDFDALDYRGTWLWHLTPRMSGTLGADRTESLVSFADTADATRNVRVTQNRRFTLDGWVSGGWHLILGISQSDQTSEHPSQATPDFRSVNGEAGIKYLTAAGSSVSVLRRTVRGDYRNSTFLIDSNTGVNDSYRQDENELQAVWILSAKSTLTGRLLWLNRENDHLTQRDFSGLAGALGYIWIPTSRLTLDFSARRDIVPWQDLDATYRVDNIVRFEPRWQASPRVTVRASLEHIQSNFLGASAATNVSSRSDTTNTISVGVTWSVLRSLTLATSLQEQRRSSNDPLSDYHDTLANISASLLF